MRVCSRGSREYLIGARAHRARQTNRGACRRALSPPPKSARLHAGGRQVWQEFAKEYYVKCIM